MITLYEFDPTGKISANHVENEVHTLLSSTIKVLVARTGLFYSDTLVVKHNGNVLTLGTDYTLVGLDLAMTAQTGLETASGIEVINQSLSNKLVLSYQTVGGVEGTNSYLVLELKERIDALLVAGIDWTSINDRPTEYPPEKHKHNVLTDLTGLKAVRDSLDGILTALVDNRVTANSHLDLNNKLERLLGIISEQRNDINRLGLFSGIQKQILDVQDTYGNRVTDLESGVLANATGLTSVNSVISQINLDLKEVELLANSVKSLIDANKIAIAASDSFARNADANARSALITAESAVDTVDELTPLVNSKLDANAKAADSELLDGLDSTKFVKVSQLSNSVTSTNNKVAATSAAVKIAYDKGVEAMSSGGTVADGFNWRKVTTDTTAVSLDGLLVGIPDNTGPLNITLPASPAINNRIAIVDIGGNFSTEGIVVLRSGSKIMGLDEDLNAWIDYTTFELIYASAIDGWVVTSADNVLSSVVNSGLENGTMPWTVISTDTTAVSGDKFMIDSSVNSVTVTLPANPISGNTISFTDYGGNFSSNNLTIIRNGSKIMGLDDDMVSNVDNISFDLTYVDTVKGWVLI